MRQLKKTRLLLLFTAAFSLAAMAQLVEDYRNVPISVGSTTYSALPDGGALISACASAASADGGARKDRCSNPYPGNTPAQRNALANCLDNGERVWALDFKIRNDSGF